MLLACAAALIWLALPARSHAAAGDLALAGCIAEGGASGCTPVGSLDGAASAAVSPDGTSVYVASPLDDSISHFTRNAAGGLAFAGCIAEGGASGCTPVGSLDGAQSVAVSPDGTSVYVAASFDDNSISHFTRNAAGGLAFAGCIAEGGASGCTPAGSLDAAASVTVSPDGASVYVASSVDDSISHFARELPARAPGPAGTGGSTGSPGGPAPDRRRPAQAGARPSSSAVR